MARITPVYLTFSQKQQVYTALKQALKPSNVEKTLWHYIDGLTDHDMVKHIAEFIPNVNINHVRSVRNECFGSLNNAHGGGGNNSKRITALEARVERLEKLLITQLGVTLPPLEN